MKFLRGSTSSPIKVENTSSATIASSIVDNLGESFFASADYTSIKKFAQEIESIISEESFVKKKEKMKGFLGPALTSRDRNLIKTFLSNLTSGTFMGSGVLDVS
jgi:hypothetical protein